MEEGNCRGVCACASVCVFLGSPSDTIDAKQVIIVERIAESRVLDRHRLLEADGTLEHLVGGGGGGCSGAARSGGNGTHTHGLLLGRERI